MLIQITLSLYGATIPMGGGTPIYHVIACAGRVGRFCTTVNVSEWGHDIQERKP